MDKENKKIQKVTIYPVEKITEKSSLLSRGLQELGLTNTILKLISEGDSLKIKALDGHRNIKNSQDTFRHIFSDLLDTDIDEIRKETEETEVLVYEVVKAANIYQMFVSLNKSFEQMCLTQDQILEFVDKHKEYKIPLDKHVIYHFLLKIDGKVFFSQICLYLTQSDSYPKWFDGSLEDVKDSWDYPADGSFRVVVPK